MLNWYYSRSDYVVSWGIEQVQGWFKAPNLIPAGHCLGYVYILHMVKPKYHILTYNFLSLESLAGPRACVCSLANYILPSRIKKNTYKNVELWSNPLQNVYNKKWPVTNSQRVFWPQIHFTPLVLWLGGQVGHLKKWNSSRNSNF